MPVILTHPQVVMGANIPHFWGQMTHDNLCEEQINVYSKY